MFLNNKPFYIDNENEKETEFRGDVSIIGSFVFLSPTH